MEVRGEDSSPYWFTKLHLRLLLVMDYLLKLGCNIHHLEEISDFKTSPKELAGCGQRGNGWQCPSYRLDLG